MTASHDDDDVVRRTRRRRAVHTSQDLRAKELGGLYFTDLRATSDSSNL